MRTKSLLLLLALFMGFAPLRADEGMWLPMLISRLNQRDLQKMGLQLTPEEIYSVNNSSLKDAIVSLGGGFCTGEIISGQGLMLTNHHCGYDAIAAKSSLENDILTNGFWAKDKGQEIPIEGLFVSFLVRMEDVTSKILPQLEGIESESERSAKIAEIGQQLAEEATTGTHYEAEVESFYVGNEFYLFVYENFNDVRLVGAPPSSVGKFGGDTDNWMWPRHTGDFSMFRVYMGPDGKPAPYSTDNIAYKPKHFLPISLKGVQEGDFAMTFGYPGSTDRYLTSFGVEQAIAKKNPTVVAIREAKLSVLRKDMKASDAVRLQYASDYASIANYWKYFIGQTEQLIANDVKTSKEKLEAEYLKWASATPERNAKYGNALEMIKQGYAITDGVVISNTYVLEGGLLGAGSVLFTYRFNKALEDLLKMPEGDEKDTRRDELKMAAAQHFEAVNIPTDRALFAATTTMYAENVPEAQQPEFLRDAKSETFAEWQKYADNVYSKSIFTNQDRLNAFLDKPSAKKLTKDPMKKAAEDFFGIYRNVGQANAEPNEMIRKGNRLFIDGLRQMYPEKIFYSDANSTMRASFGNVRDYQPKDGVTYDYYTTIEGIMQKMDNSDDEFMVPDKLVELYKAKDYGQYADKNGDLRVNFISTNDITGGNSGSPVINGKGELIGLAFDGNWEAMSGDINFEPSIQRTISVDIRYVLFMIDKVAGAKNLIEEMTLVRAENPKAPPTSAQDAPVASPTMN